MARWLVVEGQPIPVTGPPGSSFKWRGKWEEGINYNSNDVVHYQGNTYIAVASNVDETPITDDATPVENPSWNIFLEGGTGGGGTIGDEDSILLRSPDESIWRITVEDDGVLSTEEVVE